MNVIETFKSDGVFIFSPPPNHKIQQISISSDRLMDIYTYRDILGFIEAGWDIKFYSENHQI